MAKYKAYPEYKDSGVEWIGSAPKSWVVQPLKYVLNFNPLKSSYEGELDAWCSFVPMEKLKTGKLELEEERVVREVYSGYTYFEDGDVLQAKVTPCFENKNIAIASGLRNGIGFGSSEINVFRTNPAKLNRSFLFYRLQEDAYMDVCVSAMVGAGGLKRVPGDTIQSFLLALPSLEEQEKIAKFLDYEASKIDKLIEKQKQLIELLNEKRQAVISQAVTKGLDPSAPMKDSGVKWLGDVPEHWTVSKLKYLSRIKTGNRDTIDAEEFGEYPFYVRSQTVERINYFSEDCEAVLTAGDGVGVGKVYHYVNGKFAFHQRVYMLNQFESVRAKFVYYYLLANFYKVAQQGNAKSTVDSLRLPQFQNFQFSVPPLGEQDEVVSHVERKIDSLDNLISLAENTISLLNERRTSLISAAVTGKIDVRNVELT